MPGPWDPGVTLVVPVRDEELTIDGLITSIAAQTKVPRAVIFVDGGSLDRTPAILSRACEARTGWTVRRAGPATPGRARNIGIEAAQTEWVALTDAGIELDRHWLERLVRMVVADPSLEVVWGHHEAAADGWFTECASLAYVTPHRQCRLGPVRDASIASCLLRRDVWKRSGGFPDLRAAEDRIFMRRLADLGAVTGVAPEAVVWWHLQPGLVSTFRRFRVYSQVNVEAGEQAHWHHGVARLYTIALLFVVLARVRRRWAVVPLAGAGLRVASSVWKRREGRGLRWAANPLRLATVAVILGVIDAATFAGWADAFMARHRKRGV